MLKIYELPWAKRRFKKMGKDPVKELKQVFGNRECGISMWFANGLSGGLVYLFGFGIIMLGEKYLHIPFNKYSEIVFVVLTVLVFRVCHFFLWKNDKYLKYFKEFDRKPRKWKVKWAWITLAVTVADIVVFLGSVILPN